MTYKVQSWAAANEDDDATPGNATTTAIEVTSLDAKRKAYDDVNWLPTAADMIVDVTTNSNDDAK